MVCNTTEEHLAARQVVAAALASAVVDPRSPLAARGRHVDGAVIGRAWEVITHVIGQLAKRDLGMGERLPAEVSVTPLVEWLAADPETRERVYQRVFGLVVAKLCPPYETEYCPWRDATHRAQELADIAGFYRAFGLTPNRAAPERVDCIALEIEFMAFLLEKWRAALSLNNNVDHAAVCENALRAFTKDHLCWWAPTFGRLLEKRSTDLSRAGAPDEETGLRQLANVAKVLCAWVACERTVLGVEPSRRLTGPNVMPEGVDDGCGSCSSCGPCDGAAAFTNPAPG